MLITARSLLGIRNIDNSHRTCHHSHILFYLYHLAPAFNVRRRLRHVNVGSGHGPSPNEVCFPQRAPLRGSIFSPNERHIAALLRRPKAQIIIIITSAGDRSVCTHIPTCGRLAVPWELTFKVCLWHGACPAHAYPRPVTGAAASDERGAPSVTAAPTGGV